MRRETSDLISITPRSSLSPYCPVHSVSSLGAPGVNAGKGVRVGGRGGAGQRREAETVRLWGADSGSRAGAPRSPTSKGQWGRWDAYLAVLLQLLPVPLLGLLARRRLLQRLVALGEDREVHPPRAAAPRALRARPALRRLGPALQMLQDSSRLLVPLRPPSPPDEGPAARETARRLASKPGSHRHGAAGPPAEVGARRHQPLRPACASTPAARPCPARPSPAQPGRGGGRWWWGEVDGKLGMAAPPGSRARDGGGSTQPWLSGGRAQPPASHPPAKGVRVAPKLNAQ